MSFQGFPHEAITFLSEIIINNDKEWFEDNKDRYIQSILNPTKTYIEEMGEHLQILIPTIKAIPKINQSLFRIYRDARRHPARPIKERIGVIFWQGGRHRMESSCFYMHFDTSEVLVASGIRAFKPPMLAHYRDYIKHDKNRDELHNILTTLHLRGYTLPEPRYKRLPHEFDPQMTHQYLAKFGGVFVRHTVPLDETFYSEEIIDRHFALFEAMLPLQQWVYKMTLQLPADKA